MVCVPEKLAISLWDPVLIPQLAQSLVSHCVSLKFILSS